MFTVFIVHENVLNGKKTLDSLCESVIDRKMRNRQDGQISSTTKEG